MEERLPGSQQENQQILRRVIAPILPNESLQHSSSFGLNGGLSMAKAFRRRKVDQTAEVFMHMCQKMEELEVITDQEDGGSQPMRERTGQLQPFTTTWEHGPHHVTGS